MASNDPTPPPAEDFDPEQTLFFKRRNRHPNLLPFVVVGILVLGSGALLTWSMTRGGKNAAAGEGTRQETKGPVAGGALVSTAEARSLANPPVGPVQDLAGSIPAVQKQTEGAVAPAATIAPESASATAANQPPPATAEPGAPLNFDVDDPRNAAVRAQVLERIDLMPNLTATSKDKLYASVDHARKMGRVLTFPFAKGETAAHAADIEHLKQQVQTPEIKQLLDDPTVVFVVLGYADPKGSEKVNADISAKRASSVMDALRDKCGFQNVMHAVAMGGSTLFSTQDAEKNRVVELWAVVP